jgi:hypothetical protein
MFNTSTGVFTAKFTGNLDTWTYNTSICCGWTESVGPKVTYTFTQGGIHLSGGGWSGGGEIQHNGTMGAGSIGAVPEPGTLVMLGTGLIGMAGVIRRKVAI